MAKKAKKPDLRDGMWASLPGRHAGEVQTRDPGQVEDVNDRDPHFARPGSRPQADGQTTHQ